MDELALIERRQELVEKYGRTTSYASGATLAGLYFLYMFVVNHYVATYTWMIPFAIGFAVPMFATAWWSTKLDRQRRLLLDPTHDAELPAARVVPRLPSAPITPTTPLKAPDAFDDRPLEPGEGPKLLR